VIGAKKA
nr:Chain C, ILE-GLY-ALA-LYX-LYS-ALA,ILE-GLY-ALA-LYX-LYS-ALA,ILE-GLY-ALA-LYX-LYS-ALA,ILE-GLY-ALA-LYX-LYS-ALA [Xenopus laevis]5N1W_D Chain D, ILE-GLY-ALA-LYX-LYS-ALA,ILE-GLY-ALA-LYX-LYS-ALA,ILE-GLY-ALA-LYX-LYS-ALA,ILE-GLY-ALA-LYX-LYS-ALA [Xenopus laevis]